MFLNGFSRFGFGQFKIGVLGFVVVVKSFTISIFLLAVVSRNCHQKLLFLNALSKPTVRCIVCCTLYSKHGNFEPEKYLLVEQATKKMKKGRK
jgi:hypothetical protein